MQINELTKVMLRLHIEANNRGLQIYNPYFEQVGFNAVYLLVHNPDPKPLVQGLRNLNFSGAIPAGFEKSPEFADLLDELTDVSKVIGKVGIVFNKNGKLIGHYQGGQGLYASITSKYGKLTGKELVILGSGTVAKGLLLEMQMQNDLPKVLLVNRTLENAKKLASEFNFVESIVSLDDLHHQKGDVFVDTTDIGSPWNKGNEYKYSEEFVKKFKFVADVTFVPLEPQLIKIAKKIGVDCAPGYMMFMHQANICTKMILDHELDFSIYEKIMLKDFADNWS